MDSIKKNCNYSDFMVRPEPEVLHKVEDALNGALSGRAVKHDSRGGNSVT